MSKTILIKKDVSQSCRMTRKTKREREREINSLYLQSLSQPTYSSLRKEMTRKGCISYES